ncbi:MAG: MlaD family protein [Methylobacter sp.]|jgi:phospholipid/cholesterol/gamma-HCH transport system substrate-binding protein
MGRENHALITGLFLIGLVTALITVVYWIGHFERERNVYVVSTRASVSGVTPESTVFYRGISVGKVTKVLFDPEDFGTILVPIAVDKDITLTKGVYAVLRLKGVTGLTQIQLEDSGSISEVLEPGDDPKTRIPLVPSMTDKLMNSGEELLRKADHLMVRLSSLLNDENEKNIGGILSNLSSLTDKLSALQKSVDKALVGVPELSADARKTLTHVDALTNDLQSLTKDVQTLSVKAGSFADTSKVELQTTMQQVKRVATMLENNPQALLLGPSNEDSGPGEPGYKEPK